MFSIARQAVPKDALLKTYRGGARPELWGTNGDCFAVSIDRVVTLADFVFAFYTSPLFRIERMLLRVLLKAPSTDGEARALADGSSSSFAVWYVGTRSATQLLMCDRYERTRSWFCVLPLSGGRTLLQFGSAMAAAPDRTLAPSSRKRFSLLLHFHVWYSQLLLHSSKLGVARNYKVELR